MAVKLPFVIPALIVAHLALSGCSTVRYTTVYCLDKDQTLPSEPERVGEKLTGDAQQDFRIVAGSAVELRAYGTGLRTILESCRAH